MTIITNADNVSFTECQIEGIARMFLKQITKEMERPETQKKYEEWKKNRSEKQ